MSNKKSSSSTSSFTDSTGSESASDKVFSYKDSGVDVQAGDAFVDWITSSDESDYENNSEVILSVNSQDSMTSQSTKDLTRKENILKRNPHKESIVEGVGGFASLFRLDTTKYKKPCLVTCTDGVGTKVKLAADFDLYQGIGQDLVAMCVNDLICTGGDPLLFLDYLAVGKLDLEQAKKILTSIRQACRESDLALVGGETAEMPGIYKVPEFDCAGFAVGIVDEDLRLGSHLVKKTDALVGIASSGFHSNGYSLLRKVFAEEIAAKNKEIIDSLLIPTKLYVSVVKKMRAKFEVRALAHITGGGMDNVPRVIPKNLVAKIKAWDFPDLYKVVQSRTALSTKEMLNTLNCGVGMVAVVPVEQSKDLVNYLNSLGEKSFIIGEVLDRNQVQQQANEQEQTKQEDWLYAE